MIGIESAQRVLLWLRPDGWQGRARRNAWAAMVTDHQRRLEHTEVERSIGSVSVLRVQAR